jgi:hypothetical protein
VLLHQKQQRFGRTSEKQGGVCFGCASRVIEKFAHWRMLFSHHRGWTGSRCRGGLESREEHMFFIVEMGFGLIEKGLERDSGVSPFFSKSGLFKFCESNIARPMLRR